MIEGTLVNLRQRELTDHLRTHAWLNDREVTRFHPTRYAYSLAYEEAHYRLATSSGQTRERASFAIETKEGLHIGNCGLTLQYAESGSAELGIMVGDTSYWNRGYGTDAVRLLVRFGFETMNLHRIALAVYDFNARGIASYRKAGFVDEGRRRQAFYHRGCYGDTVIMSILRDEYDPGAGRGMA